MELQLISSGELGLSIANILANWIPKVQNTIQPRVVISNLKDVFHNNDEKKASEFFGFIILTPENVGKSWSDFKSMVPFNCYAVLPIDLKEIPERFNVCVEFELNKIVFYVMLSQIDSIQRDTYDSLWDELESALKIAVPKQKPNPAIATKKCVQLLEDMGHTSVVIQNVATSDVGFVFKGKTFDKENFLLNMDAKYNMVSFT